MSFDDAPSPDCPSPAAVMEVGAEQVVAVFAAAAAGQSPSPAGAGGWGRVRHLAVLASGVSYRKSVYRYQTKYQPKPRENTETEPT